MAISRRDLVRQIEVVRSALKSAQRNSSRDREIRLRAQLEILEEKLADMDKEGK